MNAENQTYRSLVRIAVKCAILTAFILVNTQVFAQNPCKGSFQKPLEKSSSFVVPCDNMVLMNLPTFSSYYYAKKNFDSLKTQIPQYKQMVDSVNKERKRSEVELKKALANQQYIISLKEQSKEEAVAEFLKVNAAYQSELKNNIVLNRVCGVSSGALAGGITSQSIEGTLIGAAIGLTVSEGINLIKKISWRKWKKK